MRLISFDVGIKNLAYCVFSINPNNWHIPQWTCSNLLSLDELTENKNDKLCCQLIKGTKKNVDHTCNKIAKWLVPNNNEISYCELHAKMHKEWIIPQKKHTLSYINKLKLSALELEYSNILLNCGEPSSKKMKKSDLVERIIKYYELKCFRNALNNVVKTKNAGEIDLVTIGRAIKKRLDSDSSIEGITHVVIENQISTIASRMKTIQGMIAQYFIMRFGDDVHIEFVSSHNKLKGFVLENGEDKSSNVKSSYKSNKTDGIVICRRFFESNSEMKDWFTIFDKSKKRDDLADCFLQGLWYLKINKIIYYADNLKINSVFVS